MEYIEFDQQQGLVILPHKSACCSKDGRLTQRAADDGWAARFLTFFAAWSLFRFGGESPLQPIAANASR